MIHNFSFSLINIIFPNRCIACNCHIGQDGEFCAKDWKLLKFITDPKCKICSAPIEFSYENSFTCAECLKKKPYYDRAISVFEYNATIKCVINDFKYNDSTHLGKKLAKFLYNLCITENLGFDIIVPVPMHKKRLTSRKYNQAALLAKHLSKFLSKPAIYNLLIKQKNIARQTTLTKKQRVKNLAGAIYINQNHQDAISGKRVAVIDDVITTAATANACARVLKLAGAANVYVITIAKTVKR